MLTASIQELQDRCCEIMRTEHSLYIKPNLRLLRRSQVAGINLQTDLYLCLQESSTLTMSSDEDPSLIPRTALPQPSKHRLQRSSTTGKRDLTQRLSDETAAEAVHHKQAKEQPKAAVSYDGEQQMTIASVNGIDGGQPGELQDGELPTDAHQKNSDSVVLARGAADPAEAPAASVRAISTQIPDASVGTAAALTRGASLRADSAAFDRASTGTGNFSNGKSEAAPQSKRSKERQAIIPGNVAALSSKAVSIDEEPAHQGPREAPASGASSQTSKAQHTGNLAGRGMARRVRQRISADEDELLRAPYSQSLPALEILRQAHVEEIVPQPANAAADPTRSEEPSQGRKVSKGDAAKSFASRDAQLLIAKAEDLRQDMHQILQLHDQLRFEKSAADKKDMRDAACSPSRSRESSGNYSCSCSLKQWVCHIWSCP